MTNQDQAALAEKALADYDFGEGVQVTDMSGWEYTMPGNERSKKVYVETTQEDDGPAPRWKLTFTVRFHDDGALQEAYAIDEKGSIWGTMLGQEGTMALGLAGIACAKSVAAGQAAVDAHQAALLCDGDASTQLWQLLASLHEWCAANAVNFDEQLKDFRASLAAGELGLPAALAAVRTSPTPQAA